MHPLMSNLQELTDEELTDKINHLYKILLSVANLEVKRQASLMLDELLALQVDRNNLKLTEQFENNELDNLIDIH